MSRTAQPSRREPKRLPPQPPPGPSCCSPRVTGCRNRAAAAMRCSITAWPRSNLARPGHALASIHLCHWQLQRPRAGEDSFALWLQHELDQGRLPLRLLFQPGETRYLADARISAPYGAWLRRIAQTMQSSPQCLTLAGHAGPSAVEQHAADLPFAACAGGPAPARDPGAGAQGAHPVAGGLASGRAAGGQRERRLARCARPPGGIRHRPC